MSKSDHLGAAVKRRDNEGHTLMHWAAKAGDVETLQLLSGACHMGKNRVGRVGLCGAPTYMSSSRPYTASLHAKSSYAHFLSDAGCPTNEYSSDNVGMSPLHWAATEGRLRASAWLLGPGNADPEGRDKQVIEEPWLHPSSISHWSFS